MRTMMQRAITGVIGRRSFFPMILAVLGLALLLTGCSVEPTADRAGQTIEGGSITGARINQAAAGSQTPFHITIAQANDPIGIDFRGTLVKGSLRVRLSDEQQKVVWEQVVPVGQFAVNTVVSAPAPGVYDLGITWEGPVQAHYNLEYQPYAIETPSIRPIALLRGVGMLLVAAGFLAFALRYRLSWAYLGLGALAWATTVTLKFAWAIPVNPVVFKSATEMLPGLTGTVIMSLYVGSLTGACEVLLTWLVLRYTRMGRVPWSKALAFSIGFGVVEAFILCLQPLSSVIAALVAPTLIPPAAMQQLALLNNPLWSLAPVSERFFVVWLHICANVLLFYSVATRSVVCLWTAFAYKTLVDTVAAYAQIAGITNLAGLWIVEGIIAIFGLAGWLGTRWVAAHYPTTSVGSPQSEPSMLPGPAAQL